MDWQVITRRLAVPLAIVTVAATATTVATVTTAAALEPAALTWKPPVTVRGQSGIALSDADFSKRKVAVTWQVPAGGSPDVGVRTSLDAGSSFGPVGTFPDARQSAIDICGTSVEVTYARRSGADWNIERATGDVDGGGYVTADVATGSGVRRHPDIACAGGRVFVTWFQKVGSGDRLYVSHALRSDRAFAAQQSLGVDASTAFGRSLALAGVNDTAYVVFARSDGRLRLKRWLVGAGPGFAVAPDATKVIAKGRAENAATEALIAAAGSKVVVAWFRCGGLFARVSNDKGLTWGSPRKLISHQACSGDFGTTPTHLAVRGSRIVLTYAAVGIESPGWMGIITSRNDFSSFRNRTVAPKLQDEHLVGFVNANGSVKMAAAFDPGNRVRYRRQK